MTKKHFIDAAEMVRNIAAGNWTDTLPDWAQMPGYVECETTELGNVSAFKLRAVWTAEAFIMLFSQHNQRFDTSRFLIACGLVSAPMQKGKRS